ncbi:hypothetical protein E1162_19105 [Rhodobacteraceae bacterium RKSG542]|uniref:DUF6949 family protein n=1 Tax=Pseudovibrio flavus TaxID=2529854 RepID=UPI0012BCE60E|nr:hypothetical protein [Pseudovibrio flavus]MTI19356.1 hypothetical protein [Pseudovibrio flavus]
MFQELLLAAYLGSAGFVFAGIVGSFFQLVTGLPLTFKTELNSFIATFARFFLYIFAGPFIVSRLVMAGRSENSLTIAGGVIASSLVMLWSVSSGLVVVHIALSLPF